MATALAERRENPLTVIRQNLQQMAPEFKAALPAHVSVEKFTRVAQTAIQNNPDLANVDRKSLFGAIVRLAQDGLLPDGREAAIVKFGDKAQAMPMIAGILKKVRQSGEVAYVSAQIVYSNDRFKWTLGFDENVEHEPAALEEEPGEPVAAYAVAVLKDGSRLLEVMRKSEIEKVRNVSRSRGAGPWVQWWGEMARKTVMRRLSKRLPMSSDLDDAFERDETMAHQERQPEPAQVIDMPRGRLDALEHQIADVEEVEPEEGKPAEDHGEAFATSDQLAEALDHLSRKVTIVDVNSLRADWLPRLDPADQDRFSTACAEKIDAIKGGE
jgi:recombination protein RecT